MLPRGCGGDPGRVGKKEGLPHCGRQGPLNYPGVERGPRITWGVRAGPQVLRGREGSRRAAGVVGVGDTYTHPCPPTSRPGPRARLSPPTCGLSGTTRKRFYGGRAGSRVARIGWRQAGEDWASEPRALPGLAGARGCYGYLVGRAGRFRKRGPGSGAMAAVAALLLLAAALAGGDDSDWVRLPSKCEGKRGRGWARARLAGRSCGARPPPAGCSGRAGELLVRRLQPQPQPQPLGLTGVLRAALPPASRPSSPVAPSAPQVEERGECGDLCSGCCCCVPGWQQVSTSAPAVEWSFPRCVPVGGCLPSFPR